MLLPDKSPALVSPRYKQVCLCVRTHTHAVNGKMNYQVDGI